jgi:hypothetical protein
MWLVEDDDVTAAQPQPPREGAEERRASEREALRERIRQSLLRCPGAELAPPA